MYGTWEAWKLKCDYVHFFVVLLRFHALRLQSVSVRFWGKTVVLVLYGSVFWLAPKPAWTCDDNTPASGALPLMTRRMPEQASRMGRRPSITERERETERGVGEQTVTAPTNDSSGVDAPLLTARQETNFKLYVQIRGMAARSWFVAKQTLHDIDRWLCRAGR